MKHIFFTGVVFFSTFLFGFSQDKGADIQTEIDKISAQMEEMMKKLEGTNSNGSILIDTLFLDSFEDLGQNGFGDLDIDAQNIEQALQELIGQFEIQMKSMQDQDWDALKELFGEFGGAFQMPDNNPNQKPAPGQDKKAKQRKTTDL